MSTKTIHYAMNRRRLRQFFSKVEITPCCWNWTGATRRGYGNFQGGSAHRFSYNWFVGPISDGLELDHTCRNVACVNPAHLEAVTHHVNVLRGQSQATEFTRQRREICRLLNVTDRHVHRLLAGNCTLSVSMAKQIRALTGRSLDDVIDRTAEVMKSYLQHRVTVASDQQAIAS